MKLLNWTKRVLRLKGTPQEWAPANMKAHLEQLNPSKPQHRDVVLKYRGELERAMVDDASRLKPLKVPQVLEARPGDLPVQIRQYRKSHDHVSDWLELS